MEKIKTRPLDGDPSELFRAGGNGTRRYFKTNAELWRKLQNYYDLECERRAGKDLEIERQVQPVGAE